MNTLNKYMIKMIFLVLVITTLTPFDVLSNELDSIPGVKKIKDFVIYEDPDFFSSFPSVIKKDDGEIIVAFRRAPDRKVFGEKSTSHIDPNSYLVSVRSRDNGISWSKEPELIYAHPYGGSQDPCLIHLDNGTLLCASYGWAQLRPEGVAAATSNPVSIRKNGEAFLGGYVLRSDNGGENWTGPFYPPTLPKEKRYTPMGDPLPAYNRGAMYQGKEGQIFWIVTGKLDDPSANNSTHLLISEDNGMTWEYSSEVASEEEITFNETSVYETPKGDVIAFMRTANYEDEACIARSTDGGKSFEPWEGMGFKGHPLQATRLPDNRVLLVYGYRHEPFGIRARILNPECTNYKTAPEIILRTDGGGYDIGYPWAVVLDDHRILVAYYFNKNNGTRYIAGSILEVD